MADWQATGSVYEFRSASWERPIGIPMLPTAATAVRCGRPNKRHKSSKRWPPIRRKSVRWCETLICTTFFRARRQTLGWHRILRSGDEDGRGVHLQARCRNGYDHVKLRGLRADARYRVSFEDGSNPAVEHSGSELAAGIDGNAQGRAWRPN